jgi:F-type H+-transporting ATPase subunit b
MEQTLQALVEILINAIPTAIFFVLLIIIFRFLLFAPLRKVLHEREALTAGAQKAAEASLAAAEKKIQEYEAKLRDARGQVYREQEDMRKQWLGDQAQQAADAKSKAEASVKQARLELASEAAAARQTLLETSAGLADQIATSILARKPTAQAEGK